MTDHCFPRQPWRDVDPIRIPSIYNYSFLSHKGDAIRCAEKVCLYHFSEEILNPTESAVSDVDFMTYAYVRYRIESLWEVHHYQVHQRSKVKRLDQVWISWVTQDWCCRKLSNMLHIVSMHDVIKHLTTYGSKRDRSVVTWCRSVSFVEDRIYVGH